MAKILVTGGSGFIGSHLITKLLARGDEVLNLDIALPFRKDHLACSRTLDILNREALQKEVELFRPDVIFNLAAIADILRGREAFLVNTVGLANLLEITSRWEKKPRLVHTSTQLVAGPGHKISGPRDYMPYTEYGVSKTESEEVLWNWNGDIDWVIVRPTTVWGPWYPTFAKSTWYYLARRWYMVPSRNEAIRTYSYVGNLVDQLIAAGETNAELVARKMFYGGDASIPTSVWLDAFSRALTGKPTRRVPYGVLKVLALGGDVTGKLGAPSPINSGRLYRMTADFAVPLQPTFDTLGSGDYSLQDGVDATVSWLYEEHADRYR